MLKLTVIFTVFFMSASMLYTTTGKLIDLMHYDRQRTQVEMPTVVLLARDGVTIDKVIPAYRR